MKRLKLDSLHAVIAIGVSLFLFFLIKNDCDWEDAFLATTSALGVIAVRALDKRIEDYGLGSEEERKED